MGVGFLGRAAAWPLGVVLAGMIELTGCSSTGGLGLLHPYLVSSDDTCGDEKTQLRSYRDYFFTSILVGAGIGAAVGGLTGYLVGGSTKDTLIGAGAGGVVGGVGGYFLAKQKAAGGDNSKLTDSVYGDVSKENSEIDGATRAFEKLRNCRLRTARQVKRDLAQHRISRDEAQTKLKEIHDWFAEDIDFADALGAKMDERGSEYADASGKIQKSPSGKRAAARHKAAKQGGDNGSGDNGSGLVAQEAARVREQPTTSSAQVALLSPGDSVTAVSDDKPTPDWTHVQLSDGRSGYVASRLLGTGGAGAAGQPPKDATGVAELTESNQLKRRALKSDIVQAKNEANGSTFELSGAISRQRPAPVPRAAA